MADLAVLLGFTFSGAALGFTLVRGGVALALVRLLAGSEVMDETIMIQSDIQETDACPIELPTMESQNPSLRSEPSKSAEVVAQSVPVDELVSCPCGLDLPAESMIEHIQSTGHTVSSSSQNVKAGKIWDLEQAIVEQTSPDCYKCGKPVKGLKRVGRTIYVSHVRCVEEIATRRPRVGGNLNSGVNRPRQRRKHSKSFTSRCPICWRRVQRRNSVALTSSTGRILRFHNACLLPDSLKQIS
ncbi:hypothetical protein J2P12_00930 [Candidatus Bathyarchaeota archaeon]|nr:hypothetical protein [Candidatus Bathyarchaeota archaeon]